MKNLIVTTKGRRRRGEGEERRGLCGIYNGKKLRITHASGEKCATQLFKEIHVGNASPAQSKRNEKER
jgi:hypothetical protein